MWTRTCDASEASATASFCSEQSKSSTRATTSEPSLPPSLAPRETDNGMTSDACDARRSAIETASCTIAGRGTKCKRFS
jgi:hypothetical protein